MKLDCGTNIETLSVVAVAVVIVVGGNANNWQRLRHALGVKTARANDRVAQELISNSAVHKTATYVFIRSPRRNEFIFI